MSDITTRIGKLMRQAEGTDNEAEAAAFMNAAQKLASQYSVDMAKARHAATVKERTAPIVRVVELGERGTRGLNTYVALLTGIAQANDLRMTIRHNSTGMHLYGFEEDVDVAEALYNSLLVQMTQASEAFKRQGDWKQDTVYVPQTWEYRRISTGKKVSKAYGQQYFWAEDIEEVHVPGQHKPVSWLSARLDFQNAFAHRVGHRLAVAAAEAKAEAREADNHDDAVYAGDVQTTAVVLVKKAEQVDEFYAQNSNARGTYRGGRSGVSSYTSSAAGRRAGDNARLTSSPALANKREIA